MTSESSHCRLRVSSEFSQSLLCAVSKVDSKLPQSCQRVFTIELNLVFWYFWYFKLLQTIEWNLKERKWRIFCTFSKKYYESFQFWFTVWLVCASIPTHPSPFWLWIAAMIKSWLQTIYSSTTYWEIGFWMHNGIFCISLLVFFILCQIWLLMKIFFFTNFQKCLHWFCVFLTEKHALSNFSSIF